jgi:hypothetical protein
MPVKLALILAASAYVWTLVLALVPPNRVDIPVPLVFLLCPACIFTPTVDPSFSTVAILLAPMNAFVYGFIGFCLGSLLRPSRS